MTKILFLNGPPGSGKDFAANYICATRSATHYKFAAPIKRVVSSLTGFSVASLEKRKSELAPQFNVTYRQLMIDMSEHWLKPCYGKAIFGYLLLDELIFSRPYCAVVSDSGFADEALPIIKHFGPEACTLIRLHREGHTFANDSRSHVNLPISSIDLTNTGDEQFIHRLNDILAGFPL